MGNKYHDAEGKFCSKDQMRDAITHELNAGRVDTALKLREQYDTLAGNSNQTEGQHMLTERERVLASYANQPAYEGNPEDVILWTPFGSRLYGLEHEGSDYDRLFLIKDTEGVSNHQVIEGDDDTTKITFNSFLRSLEKGSHTMLELKYSPFMVIRPDMDEHTRGLLTMVKAYKPGSRAVQDSFASTLRHSLFLYHKNVDDAVEKRIKKRLHALRIAHELNDFTSTGALHPHLDTKTGNYLREAARLDTRDYYHELKKLAPFDVMRYDPEKKNSAKKSAEYLSFYNQLLNDWDKA